MNEQERQRVQKRLVVWANKHMDALYGYAMIRVRQREVAEELVQETFLSAIQNYKKFAGRSSELTWLIGILRHKIADYIRQQSRQAKYEAADDPEMRFDSHGHWSPKPKAWPHDPSHLAENEEFWAVLQKCIQGLPDPLAHAFVMREMEELETEKVCQSLEISESNLWVRLHRARLRLRDCLEINWFSPEG